MNNQLLAKCGFYCGSCPTFLRSKCRGCMEEHSEGDCFTRDCVITRKLHVCGECEVFPCNTILEKERCTVLDKDWLRWKLRQKNETTG